MFKIRLFAPSPLVEGSRKIHGFPFSSQHPVKHTDLHQVRCQRRPLALGDALSRGTKLVALGHGDKAWPLHVLGITGNDGISGFLDMGW